MPLLDVLRSVPLSPRRLVANVLWRLPSTTINSRVLFILGTPRSGTTLLNSILCGSKDVAYAGSETTGIFQYRDIFSSSYGQHTLEESQKIIRTSHDIIDAYQNFINPIVSARGANAFVDKLYRVDSILINQITRYMPNASFVYISRDGRDCYSSALNHPDVIQAKSLVKFAKYYNANEQLRSKIFANASSRSYVHIKYEDMCRDPHKVIASLCSTMDIQFDACMLHPSVYSRTSNLSRAKIHENLSNAINQASISRFEQDMSKKDIVLFEKYACHALERLGYKILTR